MQGVNMTDLFMVYVGGDSKNANIELHDVRFVVGETINDCFPDLLKQWWGDKEKFHIDAWGAVKTIDGYEIKIELKPSKREEKLYFVNLGGYDRNQFTELHKNVLVAACDDEEAKTKAKQQISDWFKPHKDKMFDVESVLKLSAIGKYFINLNKTDKIIPFEFVCDYTVIPQE